VFCRDLLSRRNRASDEARDRGGQFGGIDRLVDVSLETSRQGLYPAFSSAATDIA
jgi:hypothetical protein